MDSAQLRSPEVGAVEIGRLESGKYQEVEKKMREEAAARGIVNPKMIVDLIYKEGKVSELGSTGQPYPITEAEWEIFAGDVPEYCDEVPKVYMVNGDQYAAPI